MKLSRTWSILLACPALAAAAVPPVRRISANWNVEAGPHPTSPLLAIAAGRANEGLRADWQAQLAVVQREIGFRYLRMHGLLHDDMGVYSQTSNGSPVYNFQYIDALYDALLAQRIRPFVELGFMPAALASGGQTIFWWKGNVTPPKSLPKWAALIHALVRHWKDRYGESEIRQWYFEVWNEPDLDAFFHGSLQQYLQLYQATAEAIKAECPGCRVGGPASASPYAYEQALVADCAARGVPIDFVSTHSYGVEQGFLDADGQRGTRISANPRVVGERMLHSRELLRTSRLPGLGLHFTEWNSAYTATDPMHDQYVQAPYMLEQIRTAATAVDSMAYWTFTDIFEENGPPRTPFHGGFGLMNMQGIRKPAFFAYRFLAQLGPIDLRTSDSSSWITKSASGAVAALFWDYTPVVPPAGENDQAFYRRRVPPADRPAAEVDLEGMAPGNYVLTVYRIGYRLNDPYDAYLDWGAPSQLSTAQVRSLQALATGSATSSEAVVVGADGRLERQFPLRTNDVYLVKLTRQ